MSPARPNDHRHKNRYHDFLRESRASIWFPGGGFDTARFWEIAAAGSLVIPKAMTLDMRHSLQPWEHDVPFDTLEESSDAIRFVHTVPDRADDIRAAGRQHVLRYHSRDARAE